MLKNVKTSYFLKLLFSFIAEKQKLDIIKYNKTLQDYINISLINYKLFSGKYIEYGLNGKGKEYNKEGDLIFEGEYLNWKRKGKGKEYNEEGDLIFEGEYLNGKRKGKGKEYYLNGKLMFEGEYLFDNKFNGKGYEPNGNIIYELKNGSGKVKEYSCDGIIEFEGEYLNGKRNGKGKEYDWGGKLAFEGEYLNGMRNGKAKEYDPAGNLMFKGEYKCNKKWNCKGHDKITNSSFELKEGKGFATINNNKGKLLLEAEFLNGEEYRKVKEYNEDGTLKFEGEYLNNKKNGKGK